MTARKDCHLRVFAKISPNEKGLKQVGNFIDAVEFLQKEIIEKYIEDNF